MPPKQPKSWDDEAPPKMLIVTGHRDTTTQITYLPFADHVLGIMGWEVLPHLGKSFLVYMMPVIGQHVCEIRVHATNVEPDPMNDKVIGTINLPKELFTIE